MRGHCTGARRAATRVTGSGDGALAGAKRRQRELPSHDWVGAADEAARRDLEQAHKG